MTAQSRIDDLASGSGSTAFPNIARSDVVDGLRARIADPTSLNQNAASLCGTAALLFCLLNDNPELYVQYVIDLYTTGSANLGTLTVSPGADCRRYNPPKNKIAAVDWIAMASLRDSENSAFDYQSADDETAGITMPHSLAKWFGALGYTDVRNVTNVLLTKGRSDIDSCDFLRRHGRWVCLFINAQMLETTTQASGSITPNHWVVLQSNAGIVDNALSISVYTWGSIRRVPLALAIPVNDFCKNFYGYVSALSNVAPLPANVG
ncbi:hypothetical protein [Labrys neptuniae]